ncbi:UDP-glycosyltransferase 73C5-like [Elaeis guineensis]|uniref:Glycosyltransferase n=1 Tax=Elaeis guineensis var. tenera TaxID=51953 RepID=A0A6I9S0F5_ELAGV|nr:UDP-glycosyltransferase 73C5-like [Elaeis guineensis]
MGNLHFVLIPWLAQGHMIPMVDIARLLAEHGVTVSIITTPVNAARIQSTIDRISASGRLLHFVTLRFPAAEFGLPEGCENLDSLPSRDLILNFFQATKHLRGPLLQYLRSGSSLPPSCMIIDVGHPWAQGVGRELGVPCLAFHGYSCFSLLSIHYLHHYKTHETMPSMSDSFILPGLPHRTEMTRWKLPRQFHDDVPYQEIYEEIRDAEEMADGVIVNSFDELEPGYTERIEKATGKKAWTIGPVSLQNKGRSDMAERGNKSTVDKEQCLKWLDSKKPKSVIYVSFGSMGKFSSLQLREMGAGLLASSRPFIWVIRGGQKPLEEVEKWVEERIEGRVDSRCLLIKGWAPQVMILSHPAVGGFVTHCGWNSTLEGVSAGVPMVTWPLFAEQFLNEKLIVEVLGIGVAVGVEMPMDWCKGEEGGVMVKREQLTKAVERLMDEGEEGNERRRRAKELGEKANKALEEGGSSYLSITRLIQYVAEKAMENLSV